jgi:DtxR family transcriptional regulator, Mn-dependent transcriptional regulator
MSTAVLNHQKTKRPSVSANLRSSATESSDDYLKAILELSGVERQQVSASDLAVALKISRASVTKMLQKLSATMPPLLIYEKHHGVRLAEAGAQRALEIVRHHRLIETFLHQVLGYPWDEVHDEAERLEHFISERFEERVAAKLNYPQFDPHGHPIPSLDGTVPATGSQTVAQMSVDTRGKVVSVSDRNPEMLRYLGTHGIKPGARLRLVERLPFQGSYRVLIGSTKESVLLSEPLAGAIFVAV